MSLSAITLIGRERYAVDLTAFTLGGAPYLGWRTNEIGTSRIWWRRHDAAEGTEASVARVDTYSALAMAGRSDGTTVLVVYTRGAEQDATLYAMVCDAATGAIVQEPVALGTGAKPALAVMAGNGDRIALAYKDGRNQAIHLRESYDGGLNWTAARPVLNGKVNKSSDLSLVAFGETHLSLGQVGVAGREMPEEGVVSRSRPVTAVAVTEKNRLVAVEATIRTGQTVDNLRGRIALDGLGNVIATSRTRAGTEDGTGDLAYYDTYPEFPAPLGSAVLAAGAAPGNEIVRAPVNLPAAGSVLATAAGAGAILDLTVVEGIALYAASTTSPAGGKAGWLDLTTLTAGEFDIVLGYPQAITRVGAIAADVAGVVGLIGVAYSALPLHLLRLGTWPPVAGGLTTMHRLPAQPNAIAIAITGASSGFIYVGMVDRVNVYAFDGLGSPLRLLRSHTLLTGGEVHQILALENGNIVAALGEAGVAVFGPGGELLGVGKPSTLAAMPWKPVTSYGLNALVTPREQHPYAPQRRYFICTQAGTSGVNEPAWGPTGTINDPAAGNARWTEVGPVRAVITGVAADADAGRIFAAGLLGGATVTGSRIYSFDAAGLVSAPPRTPTPQFTVAEGSLKTEPTRVEILCGDPNAVIYYTTDGSDPGLTAQVFAPLTSFLYPDSGVFHLRARALSPNLRPSVRSELHFTIDLPDLPDILVSPDPGAYLAAQTVELLSPILGTEIHYTTDGSTPTAASPIYSAPITVDFGITTIRAIGFLYGYDPSPVRTAQFIVSQRIIPLDPAAVSHVYVELGVVRDMNGSRTWNQLGTVPKLAPATVIAGRADAEGMGPFSDADYYELAGSGTGTDPFDTLMVGNFTMTLVIRSGTLGDVIFCDGAYGANGFYFQHWNGGAGRDTQVTYISSAQYLDQPALDGGIHVITFARQGTNFYCKLDKNPTSVVALGVTPTGYANSPVRIGRYSSAGNGFTGRFYEGRFIATGPASAADLDALHAAIIP